MADKQTHFIPINKGQFTLETEAREAAFEANRGHGVEEAYKENRRQWTEYPRKHHVSEYPLHVDIELASICNLRCPMCYTITAEFKKKVNAKLMDFELFKRLVDECAEGGVYSIRLSLRGEAFLHKNFIDCVHYAKEKGIKEVSSLTNGIKLDEDMFTELMHAGMDWITISIDGTGEVYEDIRRPADFKRAVEKIANYKKIKEKAGKVKPVIKVQSILPAIEENPQEFYDVFAPITDMVSANPLIDFHQSTKDMPKIENFSCPQIYQRLVIGADGRCMMCANDEENKVVVGNVNTQTIHEIWHGEKMQEVRAIHKRCAGAKEIAPCSECYLPLKTQPNPVSVGGRMVVADKYEDGNTKVADLNTPDKFKRDALNV